MRVIKTILGIIILFGIAITVSAQNTEGVVKYQRIVNLNIEPGGEWAEFKKTLPKTMTTNFILYFSEDESLFIENSKENEAPSNMTRKAMWFAGKLGKPQPKLMRYYLNKEKNIELQQTEFMTRLFREISDVQKYKWKMGAATKEILGYQCMQAEVELENKEVMAWFTADVPVPMGPEKFHGLPGLMLEVNVSQGEQVWLAGSIDFSEPVKDLLAEPKDGKKVSSDQYLKIREEKIKEWEKQQKMRKSDKAVRVNK